MAATMAKLEPIDKDKLEDLIAEWQSEQPHGAGSLLDLHQALRAHLEQPGDGELDWFKRTRRHSTAQPSKRKVLESFFSRSDGYLSLEGVASTLSVPATSTRFWNPDNSPPAALLRPEFRVVPFFGRQPERRRLERWLHGPGDCAVALITGRGGRGKTRLAIELGLALDSSLWSCAFTDDAMPVKANHLQIIDYVEDQSLSLVETFETMRQHAKGRTRLLCLARNAGDWWTRVQSESQEFADLCQHPERFVRLRLAEVAASDEEAIALYDLASEAFADALSRERIETPSASPFGRDALSICIESLSSYLGGAERASDEASAYTYMLARERAFIYRKLRSSGVSDSYYRLFESLVAIVTLKAGLSSRDELDRLMRVFRDHHQLPAEVVERFRAVLEKIYGSGSVIEPLQPDRIGETLLDVHMSEELLELASA